METNTQLLTCRYWALGTYCPDINENGIVICKRVGKSSEPAGHLHTGISALYQGPVPLKGLDLRVANAAARAGFNTLNHEALFHLIWSVRREMLHSRGPGKKPPSSRDPVYPDRYRPCGIGDNTKRKRHLLHNGVPSELLSGDCIKDKPHNRFKAEKSRSDSQAPQRSEIQTGNLSNITLINQGTRQDPICPDSDEDKRHEIASGPNKRQKLNHRHNGVTKREYENAQPANSNSNLAPSVPTMIDTNLVPSCATEQTEVKPTEHDYHSSESASQTCTAKPKPPSQPANHATDVHLDLRAARKSFDMMKRELFMCQNSLKAMYDRHSKLLGHWTVIPLLRALGDAIFAIEDKINNGDIEVDKLVDWASERKRVVGGGSCSMIKTG